MQLFSTQDSKKFTYWEEFLVLRGRLGRAICEEEFRAICEEETAPGPKRTRLGRAANYSSSSCSRHFDLNDEVAEEPAAPLSRCPRPQGQQSAIRAARSASQQSAAGGSVSHPGPARLALTNALEVQMMKQLQDTLCLYEKSVDPPTKRMYHDLIVRLRSKLGWEEEAAVGPSGGNGDGDGDGDAAGEEEAADSEDATE